MLALVTGLREGELLDLRWSDVDLDAATVTVRGSMQPDERGRRVIEETKTRSSRRLVVLPPPGGRGAAGPPDRPGAGAAAGGAACRSWGCVPQRGQQGDPAAEPAAALVVPAAGAGGAARLRFHDLRHSAATLLLARGVHPKVVSELLEHAQIGITLDLYSHVSATMLRHAADAFDELLAVNLALRRARWRMEPQASPRSSGDRATVS